MIRLGSYLWPYRRRLFLSVVFALLISFLWSLNLSITFPIVRVLFENDSLHSYVDKEIDSANQQIATYTANLDQMTEEQIEPRARMQRKLTSATQSLVLNKWIRSSVLPYVPEDKFRTILCILCLVIFASTLKGVIVYLQELLVGGLVQATANDIRRHTFENIMRLDYQSVHELGTAKLTSRLTNDVTEMSAGLHMFGAQLIREPLKAIGCIVAALMFNWRLTCISILVMPAIGYLFYRSGRTMRRAAKSTMETMGSIYHTVSETLDSTRVVIAFDGVDHHRKQMEAANTEYYTNSMKMIRVSAMIRPVTELLGIVAFTLVLIPGAYLVLNNTDEIAGVKLASGPLGIAELTTLYVLMAGSLDPIRKLSGVFPVLKRSFAAAERVFSVTDQKSRVPETASPVNVNPHCRSIEFRNISYRYHSEASNAPSGQWTLNSIDLKIPFGEVVAIVGGNGSGKSTLISLLPRLIDPDQGCVRIDDVDIRNMSFRQLRSQIGLVTQDTMLFDDTIYNNVLYGNPDATPEEVEAAIRRAHAADFISLLPQGLSTRIGAKGQKLSGGQKQRISLARAIVRNPSILIMDEATSAIDAESEAIIYEVMDEFARDRTVFIISHVIGQRFLDLVDRIVVLERGQIVANGTHAELIRTCPEYSRLVQPDVTVSKAA